MFRIENPDVAWVFDGYPEPMRKKMLRLRQLILDTATETEGVNTLEESLWEEPSYLTKGGSTLRIDWGKGHQTSTRCISIATLRWQPE